MSVYTGSPRTERISGVISTAAEQLGETYEVSTGLSDGEGFWGYGTTAVVTKGNREATVIPQWDGTARVALYITYTDRGAKVRGWHSGRNYKTTGGIVHRITEFLN